MLNRIKCRPIFLLTVCMFTVLLVPAFAGMDTVEDQENPTSRYEDPGFRDMQDDSADSGGPAAGENSSAKPVKRQSGCR